MTFKYVMMQYTFGGVQYHYAILFSEPQVHKLVAEAQRSYQHGGVRNWVRAKPVSAGEVAFEGANTLYTFGKSDSLKMEPHKDDANIILLGANGNCSFPR